MPSVLTVTCRRTARPAAGLLLVSSLPLAKTLPSLAKAWQSPSRTPGRAASCGPSLLSSASPSKLQLRHFFSLTLPRQKADDKQGESQSRSQGQDQGQSQSQDLSSRVPSTTRRLSNALKSALPVSAHENIYTIPNILTASRIIASPFIGYCILHDHHAWALGLFAYAGITDLLDGWIARRWNLGTVVGSVIDPMADKSLMMVLTVALAMKGTLPLWLAVIIIGRDVALGIAAIYYRWISLPPPKTFMRYWDFSLPSAEVHPTTISKYNTFLQLALMGTTTLAPVLPVVGGTPLTLMQYTVAVTTIWSGASYIYSKDAVKILTQQEPQTKSQDKLK